VCLNTADQPQIKLLTQVTADQSVAPQITNSTKIAVFNFRRALRVPVATVGHGAFPVAGARIWNDLPADVTSGVTMG